MPKTNLPEDRLADIRDLPADATVQVSMRVPVTILRAILKDGVEQSDTSITQTYVRVMEQFVQQRSGGGKLENIPTPTLLAELSRRGEAPLVPSKVVNMLERHNKRAARDAYNEIKRVLRRAAKSMGKKLSEGDSAGGK